MRKKIVKKTAIKHGRMLQSNWSEAVASIKYRLPSLIGQYDFICNLNAPPPILTQAST